MPCIDCMTPTKAGKTYQLEMDSERIVQMFGTLTKQVTNMTTIFEEQSRLVDHRFADIEASIQHDKESVNGEELNHDRMNARDGKKNVMIGGMTETAKNKNSSMTMNKTLIEKVMRSLGKC
ncbi:unnamed protein product [Prunus armeniaca]|uniref:Uncharacterized protein n=1 Tax=Prunus armeniaca TaxID=36596 RepID=A0A6J5TY86_PRUAR|nr:unnamed protein product [Prunus armeniaca]